MKTLSVLKHIMHNKGFFQDRMLSEIKVIHRHCGHYIPQNLVSGNGGEQYLRNGMYMFVTNNESYLFNAENDKMLKMSLPMAMVFETFLRGAMTEKIKEYMKCSFEISMGEVESVIDQANDMFIMAGCVNRPFI